MKTCPTKPDFEPISINFLDWLLKRFTMHIAGGGGLWKKAIFIVSFAYWNSGY